MSPPGGTPRRRWGRASRTMSSWPSSPKPPSSTPSSSPTASACGSRTSRRQAARLIAASTVRADHAAVGAVGGDQEHRPHCHCLDQLFRSLQSGPAVRLARQSERRAGRLEPRHLVRSGLGVQFRPRKPSAARRPLRPRRRVRRCGAGPVGQLGGRCLSPATRPAGAISTRTSSTSSTTAASIFRCAARSIRRGRRRAIRWWCRPGASGAGQGTGPPAPPRAIFAASLTLDEATEFYADVKGRLGKFGRDADELKIMPGIFPRSRPHAGRSRGQVRGTAGADPAGGRGWASSPGSPAGSI